MDPARDIIRGANRHLYAVGAGVTLLGADGAGISLCPLDHPLISLDTPGIWKFSFDFVPRKPIVFLNLYNNQFNTNYRYWYPGTWSSRVRIWPGGTGRPGDGGPLAVACRRGRRSRRIVAGLADRPGGVASGGSGHRLCARSRRKPRHAPAALGASRRVRGG